ncbi:MAG: permease [Sedimentisphaerales bacterium]|nr:permease [Sedimentisphaerales bacterium]
MINFLQSVLTDFWATIGQMSPYLLLGFVVAGILKVIIPTSFVQRHLGGKGIWPIIKSSLFGVPLPLCSCGVIPVSMSLHKRGAGKGATVAFLLSTPQTGVDSIFVTLSLLGPVFMVFRPVAALITGIIGGIAVNLFGGKESVTSETREDQDSLENRSKFMTGFKHAFVVLPRDIGLAMLIGLLAAAVISVAVPDDFFAEKIGTGIGAMILMMFLGIPVYVCATASVPVAVALIAKGLSPGAALVFLMTGPATNAAAFAILWKVLGRRTAIIYLLTVIVCALASGLIIDGMFSGLGGQIQNHYHKMGISPLEHISAVILLIVLCFGVYKKYLKL